MAGYKIISEKRKGETHHLYFVDGKEIIISNIGEFLPEAVIQITDGHSEILKKITTLNRLTYLGEH
ncbi:MAG: hypothetical protein V1788_01680 [Nanoarchaeota archaeon]|nr:hypothetical protein [Nanoarchaeota archaeon]